MNDKFFVNRLADSIESQSMLSEVADLIDSFFTQNTFVFHTSGSTGIPKEIKFCRDEIVSSAKLTASCFDLKTGSSVLLALPTRYVAGKMMVYRAIANQWKLLIAAPSSNPLAELNTPIDFVAFTPHQLAMAFEHCPEKLYLIQTIICGGGRVGKELADRIYQSGIHVFE
ncbi:MAG: AMP-binding protein, partial [Flavobacteriales bacterium]